VRDEAAQLLLNNIFVREQFAILLEGAANRFIPALHH